MNLDIVLTSPGVYYEEGIWMNSRSHPSRSLRVHFLLQIEQARSYRDRVLHQFSCHVFHPLDLFSLPFLPYLRGRPRIAAGAQRPYRCDLSPASQFEQLQRWSAERLKRRVRECDRFHGKLLFAWRGHIRSHGRGRPSSRNRTDGVRYRTERRGGADRPAVLEVLYFKVRTISGPPT